MENHHQGLVSKELFDAVQEISKNSVRKNSINQFSSKLICDVCGSFYGSRTWHAYKDKNAKYKAKVWQCQKLTKCGTPHIYDDKLGHTIGKAIRLKVNEDKELSLVIGTDEILVNRIDASIIINKVTVKNERLLIFEFLDGSKFEADLKNGLMLYVELFILRWWFY